MQETGLVKTLSAQGLKQFVSLQSDAVDVVTERFYQTHAALYERFGERGRDFCREDLVFHLEFMRPVLEFGLLQSMVDYLRWLDEVLTSRGVPSEHLAQSLDWLSEVFAERMGPVDGAIVVAGFLAARTGYQKIAGMPFKPQVSAQPWPEMATFQTALLSSNHQQAHRILQHAMDAGHSLVDFELHVVQPALYDIGEKWQANQVSVAQEHMATAIAQAVMSVGLQKSQMQASTGKRVLLACVAGNNHAVGLQMVADAFLLAGWDVQYLGADVPNASLMEQVAQWKPDLIGLSVSFPQHVRVARAFITQLAQAFGSVRPGVMIGGLAFNQFSGLAGLVGADSYLADSKRAVEFASRKAGS